MPKIKTERDPWERWKGLVLAAKERLGLTDEEIGRRLVVPGTGGGLGSARPTQRNKTVSRQTVTKWRKEPDLMPMWAFARINRVLEIEAEAARAVVPVWR